MRWGIALAVLLLPLAACIDTNAPAGASARPLLDEAAAGAGEDALLAAFTLEVRNPEKLRATMDVPTWLDDWLGADPDAGDGRAPAWIFLYGPAAGGAPTRAAVLGADGQTRPVEVPAGHLPWQPQRAITGDNWLIDSDQAAQIARAVNPAWSEAAAGPDAYVVTHLMAREGRGPLWTFEVGAAGSNASTVAAVDALNGTYLPLGVREPWAPTATEQGPMDGTATVAAPGSHTFKVNSSGHRQIRFFVDATAATDSQGLDFEARGPAGETHRFTYVMGGTALASPNNQQLFVFPGPSAGDWTFTARLRGGTTQDYLVEWCALGATACM